MRIDTMNGAIELAEGQRLGPHTTHDEFCASSLGSKSTPLIFNGSWRSYHLTQIYDSDIPIYMALYFHRDVLDMISLANCSDVFGSSWADWSIENEDRRKQWHDNWLSSTGARPGKYSWGVMESLTDLKTGGSSISLRYTRATTSEA